MKRSIIAVSLLMACRQVADYAMAAGMNSSDSIVGMLGVTGRIIH